MSDQDLIVYGCVDAEEQLWQEIALQTLQHAAAQDGYAVHVWHPGDPPPPAKALLCPLTFDLPDQIVFPLRSLFQQCRDVEGLRSLVTQQWGGLTGAGNYWLPIVLTAKGPLYAEVIEYHTSTQTYQQPFHLSDRQRQPLYQLAFQLLQRIQATPAVYLLQFGLQADHVCFDRLLPFPGAAAIASRSCQTPDLLTCHWRCLTRQPILDLRIDAPPVFQESVHPKLGEQA